MTDVVKSKGPARLARWLSLLSLLLPAAYLTHVVSELTDAEGPGTLILEEVDGRRFGIAHDDGTVTEGLEEATRQAIFNEFVEHSEEWWGTARRFRDTWSQHDDYANHTRRHARRVARQRGLHYSQVFMIYDEGIRNYWGDPALGTRWAVLKPRTR